MPKKKAEAAPSEPAPTLESMIARLEEIVSLIQNGRLGLEQSAELYEEGRRLAQRCAERLTAIQQRLEVVTPLPVANPPNPDLGFSDESHLSST